MSVQLQGVLVEARLRGLLGPGSLDAHITQAAGFAEAVPDGATFLDLGSGGGVPGLPLLVARDDLTGILVDSATRRIKFLEWAVDQLEMASRVTVAWGRAEELSRSEHLRGALPVVLSRSFGRPAVAAECARGFLAPGGLLVVSEPPAGAPSAPDTGEERWPAQPLRKLGYELGDPYRHRGFGFQVLVAVGDCPAEVPRRPGIPSKRPRF